MKKLVDALQYTCNNYVKSWKWYRYGQQQNGCQNQDKYTDPDVDVDEKDLDGAREENRQTVVNPSKQFLHQRPKGDSEY